MIAISLTYPEEVDSFLRLWRQALIFWNKQGLPTVLLLAEACRKSLIWFTPSLEWSGTQLMSLLSLLDILTQSSSDSLGNYSSPPAAEEACLSAHLSLWICSEGYWVGTIHDDDRDHLNTALCRLCPGHSTNRVTYSLKVLPSSSGWQPKAPATAHIVLGGSCVLLTVTQREVSHA